MELCFISAVTFVMVVILVATRHRRTGNCITEEHNLLQNTIVNAISRQENFVEFNEEVTTEDVQNTIKKIMREHPEIFWFSSQYLYDEATHKLFLYYDFSPSKRHFYEKEIDNAVKYLFQPDKLKELSDFEKVTYVYKWLVWNTTYNAYSSFNQTIYSVLINRNSVCTGYARTAQYLLSLVDIESQLVFGKFHDDKSYGGRHCWNIVKIGRYWYHVDFCLADPKLKYLLNDDDKAVEHNNLLWNYFCKSTKQILKNRSIESLEQYPECRKSIGRRIDVTLNLPEKQYAVCKSESGSTARVYLDSYNKGYVIKKGNPLIGIEFVQHEYGLLGCLENSEHIVKSSYLLREDNAIVLEYMTPWSELLSSNYYKYDEPQLINILIQLTQGLIACREKGITYFDIHYNNIFVSNNGVFKWGDFGLAYVSTSDGSMPDFLNGNDDVKLGSRWFMAPETYNDGIFTESSAIYSLAMIAYFLMNRMQPPFLSEKVSKWEALEKLESGCFIELPYYSLKYKSLVKVICEILNCPYSMRIDSFEMFIALLKEDHLHYPKFTQNDNFKTEGQYAGDFHNLDDFAYTKMSSGISYSENDTVAKNSFNNYDDSNIVKRVRRFFSGLALKKRNDLNEESSNCISACVYAPSEVRARKSFVIRVYMYNSNEQDAVDSKVKEVDPSLIKKDYKPLDLPLKTGDRITVRLKLSDGVACEEYTKTVTWNDHFTDCSFIARLVDCQQESIACVVYICINEIPAGEMIFTIDVTETIPVEACADVRSRRFSKVFISYAHEDESQVRGIAEGCRMLGKDYFFDRHTLQAGDVFKDKILKYIDTADLFVLCWSKNAAKSKWVQIERERAIDLITEGKSGLTIYPLSMQPYAPLPTDMSEIYNFGIL